MSVYVSYSNAFCLHLEYNLDLLLKTASIHMLWPWPTLNNLHYDLVVWTFCSSYMPKPFLPWGFCSYLPSSCNALPLNLCMAGCHAFILIPFSTQR